jgi:hypothetical protein
MSSTASLVQGGKVSTRDQFPWIVSIYKQISGKFEHRGSGSLISQKHVVCAANAVSYGTQGGQYNVVENNNVKLYFGTTKFDKVDEPGAIYVDGVNGIAKILLYPGATSAAIPRKTPSTNDIAVIFLKISVAFSQYISPVCLWKFSTKITEQVGQTAYGVGFGHNTDHWSLTGIRKHVAMTVLSDSECKNHYGEYFSNAPNNEYFCIKGEGSNFPYHNDQQVYIKANGRWYLRGTIILYDNLLKIKLCENQSSKLVDWISSVTQW